MPASLPTHSSTSGGSRETEVNELAVMPRGEAPPAVTTVTPVANVPKARRSRVASPAAAVHGGAAVSGLMRSAPSARWAAPRRAAARGPGVRG